MGIPNGFELGSTSAADLEILLNAINHEIARRQAAGESLELTTIDDSTARLTPELWAEAEKRVKGGNDE